MISVRRAVVDDVAVVREIGLTTWPVAYAGLVSAEFISDGLAQWWSPAAVERGITQGITLVAVVDEHLVGMVGLGQEAGFWVMWKLYVLPGYQRLGVGKALLDGAIEALPVGTEQLLLDVLVGNEQAIRFYRKNGFGEPRSTPDRDLGDELIWMAREL
ncbi:GNAT family N-acetyltransferase [Kribbella ginsengisoli]|uniref:N-acetyltransferase domain-containing protein n=1 Tax=Kribbella ginsengisoli TaxID=363865 RepID=A0ABP6W685_9ACTN